MRIVTLRSGTQRRRMTWGVLLIGIIVASLWRLIASSTEGSRGSDLRPYATLGQVLAEETARTLQNRGRLVVITINPAIENLPAMQAQYAAFQEALRAHPDLTILATESPVRDNEGNLRLTASTVGEMIARHSRADAIVSLVALPDLSRPESGVTPDRPPRIIGLCDPVLGEALVTKGLVELAVVPRTPAATETSRARTPRERFEREYRLIMAGGTAARP